MYISAKKFDDLDKEGFKSTWFELSEAEKPLVDFDNMSLKL